MKNDPLQKIPGIGPSIAKDLRSLGVDTPEDLKGRNPEKLYEKLIKQVGHHVDRCVLYTFRCAVNFATHDETDPERLKWWNWKDEEK